jgi:hypothetical protein
MAELLVQRKKKSIWPWIIAALLIAAIVIYFVMRNQPANNAGATPNPAYDSASGQGATKQTPGP